MTPLPFTLDEWDIINTALDYWMLECQMGRFRDTWPGYMYWKDAAPTVELVARYSETGERLSDEKLRALRESLGG